MAVQTKTKPTQSEYSLQEAAQFIAFGNAKPVAAVIVANNAKLEKARRDLQQALVLRLIPVSGIKYQIRTGGDCAASDRQNVVVKKTDYLNYDNNRIYNTSGLGVYFSPIHIDQSSFFADIKIDATELKNNFPADNTSTPIVNAPKRERPERKQVHDIVYYYWKNNQNRSAKELCNALNYVLLKFFPSLTKNGVAATLGSVSKWRTEFKKGNYKPATDKTKLSKQYQSVFSKLDDYFK